MAKLLVLFTVVPLVELYLLLALGSALGFWPTVWIVLSTGMVGAWLAKHEGFRVWGQWQRAMNEGRMPEEGVLGGLLVLVGGVLLVTPGVLTDVCGLLLLVPPSRRWVAARVRRAAERRMADGRVHVYVAQPGPAPRRNSAPPGVIDVEGESVPR